jgi:hypothetical protein
MYVDPAHASPMELPRPYERGDLGMSGDGRLIHQQEQGELACPA